MDDEEWEDNEEDEEEDDWVDNGEEQPFIEPLVQELIDAAKQGIIERVGALLDQGVAVDSRDVDQRTALIWTSSRGHRAVAALLVDRGSDVNAKSVSGFTPATEASEGGHLDILQLLVSRGADIHHRGPAGYSSLLRAAMYDRLPVCEYLLSLGVDLMAASDNNWTPLVGYGRCVRPHLSPKTKALRRAALEAAWAAGPHPSQVQRRRDERWARRGPLITVLAEHAYRPLQLRGQAMHIRLIEEENAILRRHIAALTAAVSAGSIFPSLPVVVVQYSPKEDVLRSEGLVRYIVSFL